MGSSVGMGYSRKTHLVFLLIVLPFPSNPITYLLPTLFFLIEFPESAYRRLSPKLLVENWSGRGELSSSDSSGSNLIPSAGWQERRLRHQAEEIKGQCVVFGTRPWCSSQGRGWPLLGGLQTGSIAASCSAQPAYFCLCVHGNLVGLGKAHE